MTFAFTVTCNRQMCVESSDSVNLPNYTINEMISRKQERKV